MKKFLCTIIIGLAFTISNAHAALITTNIALPDVNNTINNYANFAWGSTFNIPGKISAIDITLTWKDQGWGYRKGQIFYEIGNQGLQFLGLAEHVWKTETISINSLISPADTTLKMFYHVGGGGGHALYIRNASMTITSVAAPSIISLLGLAFVGMAYSRRRSQKA